MTRALRQSVGAPVEVAKRLEAAGYIVESPKDFGRRDLTLPADDRNGWVPVMQKIRARSLEHNIRSIAQRFKRAGDLRRAARLDRCALWRPGAAEHMCGDRVCPRCGHRWARRSLANLLRGPLGASPDAPEVWARLATHGSTASAAMTKHHNRWRRFRAHARRAGWVILGALHLWRGRAGRWLAHHHVLVFGATTIVQAWEGEGDERWEERVNLPKEAGSSFDVFLSRADYETLLGYAISGAVAPPPAEPGRRDPFTEWDAAIKGKRLMIRSPRRLARDPNKRKIAPATHEPVTHQRGPDDRDRIADRVLAIVREKPRAASAIRRRLTSGDRGMLRDVLRELQTGGRIVPVPGKRGMRWSAVEDEADAPRDGSETRRSEGSSSGSSFRCATPAAGS
jgi:hypothetical protein